MAEKTKHVVHTPGLWVYIQLNPKSDGFEIINPSNQDRIGINIGYGGGPVDVRRNDEANACLVCAAPDMYEVCREILGADLQGEIAKEEGLPAVLLEKLTNAILKAEGSDYLIYHPAKAKSPPRPRLPSSSESVNAKNAGASGVGK